MPRGVSPKLGYGPEGARRSQMRELGFKHGFDGSPKEHDDPEYRTSYRRGRERAEEVALSNRNCAQ